MHRKLGLPVSVIILLAAIAAIRVPLHDLGIVDEGSAAWLLVLAPLALWVGVVLRRRVPQPLPRPHGSRPRLRRDAGGNPPAALGAGVRRQSTELGGNLEGACSPPVWSH
jgi:hypothetical protein